MQPCVVYARVSTKEQQAEGYSIPAQLKAIRAFCEAQGLSPVAEFVEAESAGKAGRRRFGEMCAFLSDRPEVRTVVAHKLDRLYRNFRDQVTLEEDLGVRARYVLGDIPDSPQGELLRDVNLSVSKFYLGNLREEVRKGMDEKVAQGGYPHWAPVGYLNDRTTRTLVLDPVKAPIVRKAFERYASGLVSLSDLASELYHEGLRSRSGQKVYPSMLHKVLRNPIYCGLVRYKGEVFKGAHEPIISEGLFDKVQAAFEPNRNGNKGKRHVFALRDFLTCDECGCKITAERQRGHVYYRCTHGKGKDACEQRTYTREELLSEEMEALLARISIPPDIVDALVEESRLLDQEEAKGCSAERDALKRELASVEVKEGKLLDSYLDGVVQEQAYRDKARDLAEQRRTFERRMESLESGVCERTSQVEALAKTASGARLAFKEADTEGRRLLLSTVLSNATVKDGRIVSYQWKDPFGVLEQDSEGVLIERWWALEDLNL